MYLPYRAISAFHATARWGSLTKAAEELGVTPSAVSQQVQFLETHLGTSLLTRRGRGIALTEAGERYFEMIDTGIERIATATRNMRGYNAVTVLTVRAAPTLAAKCLLPALAGFLDDNPDLEVRIDATNEPTDFAREGVDVEIRHGEGRWPGLFVDPIYEETVMPLCAPQVAPPGSLGAEDLFGFRLIQSVKTLVQWPDWFRHAGIDMPSRVRRVLFDRSHMTIEAAADGLGIALESDLTTWRERRDGRLVCPMREPLPMRMVSQWFVCPHQNLRHRKVQVFIAWAREVLSRQPGGGRRP